jgi:hypothetical protein
MRKTSGSYVINQTNNHTNIIQYILPQATKPEEPKKRFDWSKVAGYFGTFVGSLLAAIIKEDK